MDYNPITLYQNPIKIPCSAGSPIPGRSQSFHPKAFIHFLGNMMEHVHGTFIHMYRCETTSQVWKAVRLVSSFNSHLWTYSWWRPKHVCLVLLVVKTWNISQTKKHITTTNNTYITIDKHHKFSFLIQWIWSAFWKWPLIVDFPIKNGDFQ